MGLKGHVRLTHQLSNVSCALAAWPPLAVMRIGQENVSQQGTKARV